MNIWRAAGLAIGFCAAMNAAQAKELGPAALAEAAVQQFEAAHLQLAQAQAATDRVRALTFVITAYEDGLSAMRAGLREAAARQAEIEAGFDAERGQISALLAALIELKPDASPEALTHPVGPIGHVRAGILVSSMTPELQRQAEDLRTRLQDVMILRELQEEAVASLSLGLKNVQTARLDLSQAMSDRVDLPRRLVTDADRVQELIDGSETLEAFASSLAVMDVFDSVVPLPNLDAARGKWPLPAQGEIISDFNDVDALGVRRPGWFYATRPLSLVATPWSATIRYQGAFLDYGNVIILEPGNDVLLILSGFSEVYGTVGDVIPAGSPIGLMGGTSPDLDDFIVNAQQGAGVELSETLYIEIREGGQPVNPAEWFTQ